MKNIRTLTLLLLLCPAIMTAEAQDQGCTIRQAYRVKDGSWLKVNSRYGDITFLSTQSDSITICATLTIQQDNRALADKSIPLIRMNTRKEGDTVSVSTIIDEKFFSSQFRAGRKSFSIDYIINLPPTTNMVVRNSFGDVSIDETDGFVKVILSHGYLNGTVFSRGNVKPVSELDLEYVKANLSEVNWIFINAKHCQSVTINKAKAAVLTTEYSKFSLGEAGSLVCKSRSDNYRIGTVKNLVAESIYSAYDIGILYSKLQALTKYGTIKIDEVKNDFSLIDITATHTPVDLTTQEGSSYKCSISLVNTPFEFDLAGNPAVSKSINGTTTILTGKAGKNTDPQGEIKMLLQLGLLRLR